VKETLNITLTSTVSLFNNLETTWS